MSKKNVKKISALIGVSMACAIAFGVSGFSRANFANAQNKKAEFSSKITAVSHVNGTTVNILPQEVKLWTESKEFNADYLNGLYEYGALHKEFLSAVNTDNNRVAEIYREADVFNPVNNVLKWESTVGNVTSYTVRVAYDRKFTQCILKAENADIAKGVEIENPLAGTDYYWQVIATTSGGGKVYSPIFDFTTADSMRTVTIDGVSNTRDIGGYETAYGYVRQGLVFRSARLESISDDGLETLKNELGVKTDLDLRGKAEANVSANRENPAQLPNYYVYATPQYALAGDLGLDSAQHYESVKNIMTVFTDKNNYPMDIHCAVGRDRTGTITALLKAILGYSENDIINDYFTSMFATTGAWAKETTYINKEMILNVLRYLNTFEGDTLADKSANYLISKCGMTQGDIDAIRDIMTGKVAVEIPAEVTFSDADNYAEYSFVTFEKFGTARVVQMLGAGETATMPFEAGEGYTWTVNGQAYDFTATVEGDMVIQATKVKPYAVKIIATGALTSEETVMVNAGESFDFTSLEQNGYDYIVLSDEGKIITELTVAGNTTLNVIYVKGE